MKETRKQDRQKGEKEGREREKNRSFNAVKFAYPVIPACLHPCILPFYYCKIQTVSKLLKARKNFVEIDIISLG